MMIRRWTQVTAEKQHLAGMIELPTGVLLGLKQAVTAKKRTRRQMIRTHLPFYEWPANKV